MRQILFSCLTLLLLFSCDSLPGNGNGGGILDPAINLECSYNSNINLTNHNPDGVDYRASCLVRVVGGTMTIEPGTLIEFDEGTGLVIDGMGILKAEGSSGSSVVMRSSAGTSPSWRGLHIESTQGKNVLNHVEIHNAGDGESFALFSDLNAAITVSGRVEMTNSLINNSGGIGFYTDETLGEVTIDNLKDNVFENCSSYPIYINMNNAHNVDFGSNDYVENGENLIGFHGLDGDRLKADLTLSALEIPYFLESGIDLHADLILEAGVDLTMGSNAYIHVTNVAVPSLTVQGTQSNHVTIRGKESLSGYWQGILIKQESVKNIFEYLDISDGGSQAMSFSDLKGNITLEFGGSLTLTNTTSARSGSDCDVVLSNFGGENTFENDNMNMMVCED